MFIFKVVYIVLSCGLIHNVFATELNAAEILRQINLRERGNDLIWNLTIDLIDRNGSIRKRTGKIFRRMLDNNRNEQVTVFLSPANIRHTALLEIETETGEDYMWLYIPALKATKRIPPADRGDKFVGTDFTMEDVNLGFKYEDYMGTIQETKTQDGHPIAIMHIEPKTDDLKANLGFDYSIATVRTDQYMIVEQRFFKREREIRRNTASKITAISGVLTPMELSSIDLVNDHRTNLHVNTAMYNSDLSPTLFRKEALVREMYQ